MLTVASPLEDASTIAVRAHAVELALTRARAQRQGVKGRAIRFRSWSAFRIPTPEEAVERNIRACSCNSPKRRDFSAEPKFCTVRGSWPPMD